MEYEKLLKNWKIWLVIVLIFFSAGILFSNGLNLGIDFKGGTLFTVQLAETVDNDQMERITNVIEQRLNWTGLKDTKVFSLGNQFVVAQIAETNPKEVARIESILKRQGKFEATIVNKKGTFSDVMFTGAEIIEVDQSTAHVAAVSKGDGFAKWSLPFVLKKEAAINFRNLAFHRCELISFNPQNKSEYDCAYTYLFIDRPSRTAIVFSETTFENDSALFSTGNGIIGFGAGTKIKNILANVNVPYFTALDSGLKSEDFNALKSLIVSKKIDLIIVPDTLSVSALTQLNSLDVKVREISVQEGRPWLWDVSGLRSIVRLQPSVTGNSPRVEFVDQAKILTELIISGTAVTLEDAQNERNETKIILQAGSLPVSVENISKESISPLLGKNFLFQTGLIGLVVLIVVASVIFFRYRQLKLSVAIMFTVMVEAFVTLGFTSVLGNIDLAAIAGIIAAVGTGVDDQIVISDEMLKGETRAETSLVKRVKNAFFIVIAAAATLIATMFPILLFGTSMVKIFGFAIATIVGVTIGVLITRPAFAELAKLILKD